VVRPGQHGAYVGGRVPSAERIEIGLVVGAAQLPGQVRERDGRVQHGPRGHDHERQRQRRAPGQDLVDRDRVVGEPVPAQPVPQHPGRLRGAEQVQRQRVRALRGDQPGQLVAAGHHDQAGGRSGQQRAYLFGVGGVVQHDQHPAVRQQAPVRADLGLQPGGHPAGRDVERLQEAA
jgi:hypothetical protein